MLKTIIGASFRSEVVERKVKAYNVYLGAIPTRSKLTQLPPGTKLEQLGTIMLAVEQKNNLWVPMEDSKAWYRLNEKGIPVTPPLEVNDTLTRKLDRKNKYWINTRECVSEPLVQFLQHIVSDKDALLAQTIQPTNNTRYREKLASRWVGIPERSIEEGARIYAVQLSAPKPGVELFDTEAYSMAINKITSSWGLTLDNTP